MSDLPVQRIGSFGGPADAWAPLVLCQDFLGHRTHADILQDYLARDPGCRTSVIRFSFADYRQPARFLWRLAGARVPLSFIQRHSLDLWSTRAFLVQGALAARAGRRGPAAPDMVYVHSHMAGPVVLGMDPSIPVILSVDGTIADALRMDGKSRPAILDRPVLALERMMFDRADLIVSFSDWARTSLIKDYGVPERKTITIRNAIPDPLTGPAVGHVAGAPRNAGRPVMGFVGNDLIRKGGDLVIEAHQRHLADDCDLMVVSSDPAVPRGLRNTTILSDVPRHQLLSEVVPRFDLCMHPARKDWSPYSVIESLSLGIPIIGSHVGSLPEMVVDGVNGLLIDEITVEGVVSAVRALLADPARRVRMAAASRQLFLDRYDAAKAYPRLIDVMRECAADRDSPVQTAHGSADR